MIGSVAFSSRCWPRWLALHRSCPYENHVRYTGAIYFDFAHKTNLQTFYSSTGLIHARREGSSNETSEANSDNSIENEGYNTLAPLEVASLNPGTEDFSLSDDCRRRQDNDNSSMPDKHLSWLLYVSGMIGMSFLNPLCCILAMQYANPSILAPFSGLTLVWIILLSGVVVGEYPGWSQKVACLLIVTGEVFVALFGDHTNDGKDIEDVISSYEEPAFHYFFW